MALPVSQRLYAVVCDSTKHDTPHHIIAHLDPSFYGRVHGYWVEFNPAHVGAFSLEAAQTVMARLRYNNPRIMHYHKAVMRIATQHRAGVTPTAHQILQAEAAARALIAERTAAPQPATT